jgi:EmrB/QacA subfamily drug resistance transporter
LTAIFKDFDKSKLLILLSLALSSAAVLMDSALVPVALPTIQKDLNLSNLTLEWVINAYALVLASFFLLGGKIGDLFGHRRIYCLGMAVFVVGSLVCGTSMSSFQLILARIVQGMGGALMVPSSMALVMDNFKPQERGRCIGILVAIASLFLSFAPFIGGTLTECISWRGVFWVHVPLLIVAKIMGLIYIPRSDKIKEPLDILGFIYFALGFFSIVLGLMLLRDSRLVHSTSSFLFILGIASFAFLHRHLKLQQHPFIDYRLFKNKTFKYGNLLIFCAQFLMMISAYWTMYFQKGLGFTPIKAGLFALISSCPLIVCAPLSGYLCDRFGPRLPCVMGFSCTLLSFSYFCLKCTTLTVMGLGFGLICFGIGVSLVMTPIGAATVGCIATSRIGLASGLYGTIRNSAMPLGFAVFGSMISNISSYKFSKKLVQQFNFSLGEASFYRNSFSTQTPLDQCASALSLEKLQLVQQTFFEALRESFFYCNLLCMVLSIICLFVSMFYLPSNIKNKIKITFN